MLKAVWFFNEPTTCTHWLCGNRCAHLVRICYTIVHRHLKRQQKHRTSLYPSCQQDGFRSKQACDPQRIDARSCDGESTSSRQDALHV